MTSRQDERLPRRYDEARSCCVHDDRRGARLEGTRRAIVEQRRGVASGECAALSPRERQPLGVTAAFSRFGVDRARSPSLEPGGIPIAGYDIITHDFDHFPHRHDNGTSPDGPAATVAELLSNDAQWQNWYGWAAVVLGMVGGLVGLLVVILLGLFQKVGKQKKHGVAPFGGVCVPDWWGGRCYLFGASTNTCDEGDDGRSSGAFASGEETPPWRAARLSST